MTRRAHELALEMVNEMRRFADAIETDDVTDTKMFNGFVPILQAFQQALTQTMYKDAAAAVGYAATFMNRVEKDIEDNAGPDSNDTDL